MTDLHKALGLDDPSRMVIYRRIDDDLEDDAPARSPTRRDGRIIAMQAEPIPAEVNDAFLEDLAFERALSAARGLAVGLSVSTEPPRGGLQAVWGRNGPVRRHLGRPGPSLAI
jgi:hypothetical protein